MKSFDKWMKNLEPIKEQKGIGGGCGRSKSEAVVSDNNTSIGYTTVGNCSKDEFVGIATGTDAIVVPDTVSVAYSYIFRCLTCCRNFQIMGTVSVAPIVNVCPHCLSHDVSKRIP